MEIRKNDVSDVVDWRNVCLADTLETALAVVREFEQETVSKFSVRSSKVKGFGQTEYDPSIRHKIFWEEKGGAGLPFNQIPFIVVNNMFLDCAYGPDRHKSQRKKVAQNPDHSYLMEKAVVQRARKKKGCPAYIQLKEVIFFLDYCISNNTRSLKERMSKTLRQELRSELVVRQERRIIVHLPAPSEHFSHPTGQGIQRCETCGRTFFSSRALSDHKVKHCDDRPYECHKCGLKFRLASGLTRHAAIHGDPNYAFECDICGKTFNQAVYLKRHRVVHIQDRHRYKCPQCPKLFRHKGTMVRHSRLHGDYDYDQAHDKTNDENHSYKCPHCDLYFATIIIRGKHIRKYHRQPSGCPYCDMTFRSDNLLTMHMAENHGTVLVDVSEEQHTEEIEIEETVLTESLETVEDKSEILGEVQEIVKPKTEIMLCEEPVVSEAEDSESETIVPSPIGTCQDQTIEVTVDELAESLQVIQHVEKPDFTSQEFYNWLSRFAASCKMLVLPIVPEVFMRITQVQKILLDNMSSPDGVFANKDNFQVLFNITKDLQQVLNSHLTYVYDRLSK